jgi:probable AcnD-accessory protein PrpF
VVSALRIPAVYMRGGTSKGVFFRAADLPAAGPARDRLLLRVIGSPDRYGQHIDGMGGGTSSTSKVVLLAPSARDDSDVDFLFGQVAIERAMIDWSGNCGNLSAAVGPCAIGMALLGVVPRDGIALVRIWQSNIARRIVAHVPMRGGEVVEAGDFELDGVAFPAAEIRLEFIDPAGGADDEADALFPSGARIDRLMVPGLGPIEATLIDAGNPTVFVAAASLGLRGTEMPAALNADSALLLRAEQIRAEGAVAMGLAASAADATAMRPHTPKLAFVAAPADYVASSGTAVAASSIDLLARIFSMGRAHHAFTGTGAVALAAAAAVPDTLVSRVTGPRCDTMLRFGHPSGVLQVGASAQQRGDTWAVTKVTMSRSARRLMDGWVHVPANGAA